MNTPEKELSESLLAACKAAGIEKPKYIAQDKSGKIYHYSGKPNMTKCEWIFGDLEDDLDYLNHPPYAENWKESLLEWVEPQGGLTLADVLARNSHHVADARKKVSGIEALVCEDIAKRQQVGIAKYGTTVADNPLTHQQWLQHAYEECLDMAVYLKRAMTEKGGIK